MQDERRKYIRFDVPLDIIVKPAGADVPYSAGITRNFSRDGCCIESDNLNIASTGNLELRVKHPVRDTYVNAKINIVWKQHVGGKWLAGIKITDMDKEAKSEILDFAYDIWLEEHSRHDSV